MKWMGKIMNDIEFLNFGICMILKYVKSRLF